MHSTASTKSNTTTTTTTNTTANELVNRIETYIIATKTHSAPSNYNNNKHYKYYLHLFLDIDMSVLGKTSLAYDAYAYAIRQEYAFVPHDVYCTKRADILESFLQRDYIFDNVVMRGVLEGQCRDNLKREIGFLRKGVIPCMDMK
mmetsp:Transcript_2648/g.3610  ORF Transcript_2648/g.3610 Transcript_2648/m.3610 type:complete len:145 (+) Transcript_2648:640-1074(+)